MTITDHDRKLLWGRSGNRCVICRRLLVFDKSEVDRESIVGDESHIISPSERGPRGGTIPEGGIDVYDNLILLCKVDHKRVDDQPSTFSAEDLRAMKLAHERWVDLALSVERPRTQKVTGDRDSGRVSRVGSGSELLGLVGGCHGYDFDNDELDDDAEVELVASSLQKLHDLGEIYDELESRDRVQARHELDQDLKQIEEAGFIVYGARTERRIGVGGREHKAWVSTIRVMHVTNPTIWDPAVIAEVKRRVEEELEKGAESA